MDGESLARQLAEAGYKSVEDILVALETRERSDVWVFVSCDRDEDGNLQLINATGFYPDEWTAALAGQTYVRNWEVNMTDDDPPPMTFPIPLFVESPVG